MAFHYRKSNNSSSSSSKSNNSSTGRGSGSSSRPALFHKRTKSNQSHSPSAHYTSGFSINSYGTSIPRDSFIHALHTSPSGTDLSSTFSSSSVSTWSVNQLDSAQMYSPHSNTFNQHFMEVANHDSGEYSGSTNTNTEDALLSASDETWTRGRGQQMGSAAAGTYQNRRKSGGVASGRAQGNSRGPVFDNETTETPNPTFYYSRSGGRATRGENEHGETTDDDYDDSMFFDEHKYRLNEFHRVLRCDQIANDSFYQDSSRHYHLQDEKIKLTDVFTIRRDQPNHCKPVSEDPDILEV